MNCFRTIVAASCLAFACSGIALATGTARIQKADGGVRYYRNVKIVIANRKMSVTTSNGVGKLVIDKAGCMASGELVRCYPFDAVVYQRGDARRIPIASGTAYVNPTSMAMQLPLSSMRLPPRGVLLVMRTQTGAYFSLNGVADVLKR